MASNFDLQGKVSLKDETGQGIKSAKDGFAGLKEAAASAGLAITSALALQKITDFGRDIFSSFSEAETVMVSFETRLKNVTGTTDAMREALLQAGKQALQFGVDDEVAINQLSIFYARTKDVASALTLHNLALQIAAASNKSYEEASMAVTQVLNGQSKALKLMGFDIDENASAIKTLGQVATLTMGAIGAQTNTAKVQVAKFREEWDNVKQSLGAVVAGALIPLIRVISSLFDWYTSLNPVLQKFISFLATTGIVAATVATIAIASIAAWHALTVAFVALGIAGSVAFGWIAAIGVVIGLVVGAIGYFTSSVNTATDQTSELNVTAAELQKNLTGIDDGSLAVSNSMKQLAADSKQAATDIAKLREEMKKTVEEGMQKQQDISKSAAEEIVAQQQKVYEIQKQLNTDLQEFNKAKEEGATEDKKMELYNRVAATENSLNQESSALEKYNAHKLGLDTEYTEALRRSNETEFERRMEDINQERIAAAKLTTDKIKEQAKQLKDLQSHLAEIQTEEKKNTDFIMAEQAKQTFGWDAVARARENAVSRSSQMLPPGVFNPLPNPFMSDRIPGLATGGSVSPYSPYIVGENGPELFVPKSAGSIVPNLGGTTVNIFNPMLLDDSMIEKVGQQIMRMVGRDLRY